MLLMQPFFLHVSHTGILKNYDESELSAGKLPANTFLIKITKSLSSSLTLIS